METLAGLTQMQVLNELVIASERGIHCLTLNELAERIRSPRKVIVKRMQALMYNKYAKSLKIGCYAATPQGYKRHMDGGEIKSGPKTGSKVNFRAPNRISLRARLWKALRMLKRATISDLLQVAVSDKDSDSARDSAHRLLSQLTRTGCLTSAPMRQI